MCKVTTSPSKMPADMSSRKQRWSFKRHQFVQGTLIQYFPTVRVAIYAISLFVLLFCVHRWRQPEEFRLNKTPPLEQVPPSALSSSITSSVVDVVSIGSNTRWNYVDTQRETWAKDESIRSFEGISEDHHKHHGSCAQVKAEAAQCDTEIWADRKQPPNMRREDFRFQSSEGWLCAQRRPAIALGDVIANKYVPRGEEDIPDWLLLVDDDTLFHMDVFKISVSQLDPDDVYVLAGSHIWENDRAWPYGGSGVALSRGALRRLFTPLFCDDWLDNVDEYEIHACETLKKNNAFELENFLDGMSIADLMLSIAVERKPFCWHSDWMTGWFFSNYLLMGWTIPRFPGCPEPYQCQPSDEAIKNCGASLLVCHYQTPEMMRADDASRI